MLNQEQFEAKWKEIKGGIRNLWGKITDDELEQYKGNLSEITGLVEERYNESKHDIKTKMQHLFESFDNETDKGVSPDHPSFMRSPLGEPETFDQTEHSRPDRVNTSPQRLH